MIPALVKLTGAPWKVLPSGVYPASLSEVDNYFATNPHRRMLFNGLVSAAKALSISNVQRIFLDGSFVTGKPKPNDYDGCWDPTGVAPHLLDPVFLDFSTGCSAQKAKYKGEFFPSTVENSSNGQLFVDFFQIDKYTGSKKGIILIDLKSESFASSKEVQ